MFALILTLFSKCNNAEKIIEITELLNTPNINCKILHNLKQNKFCLLLLFFNYSPAYDYAKHLC
jgi:hypothetical protein